ncbi:hypothetical protein FHG71_02310 [Rubellimicrobium roseum]|uniref:Soluble ligand binding domain-containing protein n=1 Tax=Rubellimicrobium roseum TaxID=687525 RepID=A0A5C4NQL8_9RHOB|nr:hypothetical protein FHG71_02310 [Rubellimicrobium roseum]
MAAMATRLQPLRDAAEARLAVLAESWRSDGAASAVATVPPTVGHVSDPAPEASQADRADIVPVAQPEPERPILAGCDSPGDNSDVVVLGDRLALRFFEHSTLASAPSMDGAPGSESIVFERLDLSGSFEVGTSGAVSLPAIGHVDVIGRSLPCVEALVTLAASERLRLTGSVSAAFAARPPVLVRGLVRAPGEHAYSPGLTVERVLAQAGAIEADPLTPSQRDDLRAREHELDALAASLILERARIDAALSGERALADDPDAWDAVEEALGADRVRIERGVLLAEIAEEEAEEQRASDRIDSLVGRLSAAQAHLAAAQTHLAYLSDREAELSDRMQRGLATDDAVDAATMQRMDMEQTVLERRDALLQLEGELRLARHEAALREAERHNRLAILALEATKERTQVGEQLRAVRAQLAMERRDARVFAVTIERSEIDGVARFVADPETRVRPGDLVTVTPADAPAEIPAADGRRTLPPDPVTPVSWR